MSILIFAYLVLFPFGKLVGVIPDLVIILIATLSQTKFAKLRLFRLKWRNPFLVVCAFSLVFSLSFFKVPQIFTGALYLIRLVAYFFLSRIVQERFGKTKNKRALIFNSLIIVGIFIALFGWLQYFFYPDLTALKTLGWDDHYYRLVGTFLDPAFTGILLVLTEILVLVRTLVKKSTANYILNIFLILTILFTYSRASYLALVFVLFILAMKFREKFIVLLILLFLSLIPFLPKTVGGEGVNLARTYSITDKFINYKDSLVLIKKSPIFGLGFDNICVAKEKFLHEANNSSHACNGLDNSILFIIATTGIIGLIAFLYSILRIVKTTELNEYGIALLISFGAIFIHGMFTETFFYNFILGWVAILIGVTRD